MMTYGLGNNKERRNVGEIYGFWGYFTKPRLGFPFWLIELYWDLGKELSEKSKSSTWGSGIMEKISIDLKHEFPEITGFSRRNLYAIKQWFEFYHKDFEFVPQLVAQIPWGHNRLIISKVNTVREALFYTAETVNQGWSRDVRLGHGKGFAFVGKESSNCNFCKGTR